MLNIAQIYTLPPIIYNSRTSKFMFDSYYLKRGSSLFYYQHKSTWVNTNINKLETSQYESTRIYTSLTQVNTSQHKSGTSQHDFDTNQHESKIGLDQILLKIHDLLDHKTLHFYKGIYFIKHSLLYIWFTSKKDLM